MIAQYTAAALVAECRRLAVPASADTHPDLGDAGGPRVDGLVGGPQAADGAHPPGPGAGGGAGHRGARHRPAGAAGPGAGDRRRPRRPAGRRGGPAGPRSAAGARAGGGRRTSSATARSCGRPSGRWDPLPDSAAHRPGAAGSERSCKGWAQEAALRMLMNNLDPEVAERPQDLVVYGGTGRAARSWEAFDAIVASLRGLEDDETLLVQSGKPVAVLPHPRVGAPGADRQLQPRARLGDLGRVPAPRGARPDDVRPDDRRVVDLHRHPGDPPGHLRVLLRHRRAPLRRHPGRHGHGHGRARGHGRRPAAGRDDERRRGHRRRGRPRPHPTPAGDPLPRRRPPTTSTTPSARAEAARADRHPLSIGAAGQRRRGAAPAGRRWTRRSTSSPTRRPAHDPLSYVPAGPVARRGRRPARGATPTGTRPGPASRWPATARRWSPSPTGAPRCSTTATACGAEAELGGFERAFDYPGFLPAYIRPLFCEGKGPFRWAALSGDPADIGATDKAVLDEFPDNEALARWIRLASDRVAFQGLPARICWLGYGERDRMGLRFNELVAAGKVQAPIVIGRDHLDSGSVASPYRETEAMRDGSDAIADWPLLNALLSTASGASWVSHPPRRRRGDRPVDPRGDGGRGRRHRAGGPEARTGAHQRPGQRRRPPRRRRLPGGAAGGPGHRDAAAHAAVTTLLGRPRPAARRRGGRRRARLRRRRPAGRRSGLASTGRRRGRDGAGRARAARPGRRPLPRLPPGPAGRRRRRRLLGLAGGDVRAGRPARPRPLRGAGRRRVRRAGAGRRHHRPRVPLPAPAGRDGRRRVRGGAAGRHPARAARHLLPAGRLRAASRSIPCSGGSATATSSGGRPGPRRWPPPTPTSPWAPPSTASGRSTRRRSAPWPAWARARQVPLHLHLSEQPAENEACLAATGRTPDPARPRPRGARPGHHGGALHARDRRRHRAAGGRRGTAACLCPTTERDLADGIGPAAALAAAGCPLRVGSDSHAVADLFEEARAVEIGRAAGHRPPRASTSPGAAAGRGHGRRRRCGRGAGRPVRRRARRRPAGRRRPRRPGADAGGGGDRRRRHRRGRGGPPRRAGRRPLGDGRRRRAAGGHRGGALMWDLLITDTAGRRGHRRGGRAHRLGRPGDARAAGGRRRPSPGRPAGGWSRPAWSTATPTSCSAATGRGSGSSAWRAPATRPSRPPAAASARRCGPRAPRPTPSCSTAPPARAAALAARRGHDRRGQVRLRARPRHRAADAARRPAPPRAGARRRGHDVPRRPRRPARVRRRRRRLRRASCATRCSRPWRPRAWPTPSTASASGSRSRRPARPGAHRRAAALGAAGEAARRPAERRRRRRAGRPPPRPVGRPPRAHVTGGRRGPGRRPGRWRCCCRAPPTCCATTPCPRSTPCAAAGVPMAVATDCNPGHVAARLAAARHAPGLHPLRPDRRRGGRRRHRARGRARWAWPARPA